MARVLLINPSYSGSYGSTKAGLVNPIHPTLGLLAIAAEVERRGHRVDILDLCHVPYDWRSVRSAISDGKPDVVGITATTPLMNQLRDISVLCKDVSKDIVVVGGGAHISALPGESMEESLLDVAIPGEAEGAFGEVCDGLDPRGIRGVWHRTAAGAVATEPRPLVEDLDDLPMPAWHLYDPRAYRDKISRILARQPPVTMAEFSRGCVYHCDFCASKSTMGLGYRKKSPERCADEVRAIQRLGWGEFFLADDIFTSDVRWAQRVSEAIVRAGTDVVWSCTNGIRVESATTDLFSLMRQAGCYRVSFGFESGNDDVLRAFGKGGKASLEKGRIACRLARAAGIDVNGFLLLGLSADTEETMQETIEYARTLELDMLKFGITIAFPGTPMFREYAERGLIRTYDWDDYHVYTDKPVHDHPRLSFETITRTMEKAYRRAIIWNPGFVARRVARGLRTGEVFRDAYYFAKFTLRSTMNESPPTEYYARDRWPTHDFTTTPPVWVPPPVAKPPKAARLPVLA